MTTQIRLPVSTPAGRPSQARGTTSPGLDGFLEALDPTVMGPRLTAALGSERRACHVVDAKYEPGVRAVVLYQLGTDLVRGDLLAATSSAQAHPRIEPGLRVSVFPHDPDLPALPRAVDPTEVGPLLARGLGVRERLDRRALALRCRVFVLRYRPGKRATVRITAGLGAAGYVAKVYHDPGKAAAVALEAERLAAVVRPQAGILRFAPTLAHPSELSMVVQQAVQGESLDALITGSAGRSAAAAQGIQLAARALAEMHSGPIVSTRQRPVEQELRRFVARAMRIAAVDPQPGRTLASLAERLLDTHVGLPSGRVGLVHGDCKPAQFLLAGPGQVYLLDLDHCGVSDQAGDVGTFAASLRQLAVRRIAAGARPTQTAGLIALAEDFIAAYTQLRKGVDLDTAIRWHEVVALQRKALRAYARAPRSPLPTALVEEGHRCLDTVMRGWR